jgi:hypothetical protein
MTKKLFLTVVIVSILSGILLGHVRIKYVRPDTTFFLVDDPVNFDVEVKYEIIFKFFKSNNT